MCGPTPRGDQKVGNRSNWGPRPAFPRKISKFSLKSPPPICSRPIRGRKAKPTKCDPDAPGLCTQIWKLKQKPTARVGVVKSLDFSIADRAGTSREWPQNSGKLFF